MDIILSIITINLNNSEGLKTTISSVISQTYLNYEYIIIDGVSSDGSIDIVKKHTSKITQWISEPDTGIYNAMNKGIQMAKGEYCLFVNSGDWLVDENILSNVFATNPSADIISGDVYFYDTEKMEIKWLVRTPQEITAKTIFNGTIPHQATLIKRNLFDKFGLYNENLRIASDWLFFLEVLLEHGASYSHYNGVISYFNIEGISCMPNTKDLPRREQLAVLQKKYPRFIADYERLKQLEEDDMSWKGSREYLVFNCMKKTGIIGVGVFLTRVLNYFSRKIKRN